MIIELNGQPKEVSKNVTIGEILAQLNLHIDRVVLELNQCILAATESSATTLCAGDKLEIIEFVGGG